jgi:hypothetical protein
MAESPEHQYLSSSFLSVLNNFSRSSLYSYRESDRGKFDFSCTLAESWDRALDGQTLWKHGEGIDKDIRTLLLATTAPISVYIARDTTKHRSVFHEAINDYRHIRSSESSRHFRVFWVPADFDADSEEARHLVGSQLRREVAEDILFNIVFGRLSAARVAAIVWASFRNPGLEVAALHSVAINGFISLNHIAGELSVSTGTIRDRLYQLQMSGLLMQERRAGQTYHVSAAGRSYLRLSAQLHGFANGIPLSPQTVAMLRMLGAEPGDEPAEIFSHEEDGRTLSSPKSTFALMTGKAVMADVNYGIDWRRSDFKYTPDEQNADRWLLL